VRDTSGFLDSSTTAASMILVFFTPQYGITSVLTISADFVGFAAATVSVDLDHFEMLEGPTLVSYLAVQITVLVSISIMFADIVYSFKNLLLEARLNGHRWPRLSATFKVLLDLALCVSVVAFVVMRIPSKTSSVPETKALVGAISDIPWKSDSLSMKAKTDTFFKNLTRLLSLIKAGGQLDLFCSLILFASLLRIIQCTDIHPRLALVTGTLAKALDDLQHVGILIMMLMMCFAGIATWRWVWEGFRSQTPGLFSSCR